MSSDLTVVKLGGSLITHKDRPLTLNLRGIEVAAKAVANSLRTRKPHRLILIHGGGSFGHYYAKKFFLSTTRKRIRADNASLIAASMITLHSVILDRLVKHGVPCKTILTSEFLKSDGKEVTNSGSETLESLLQSGFVPATFGNVSISKQGSAIISGDQIALSIAKKMRVKRMIFAMDVDGIYADSRMEGEIIEQLDSKKFKQLKLRKYDVTGGIKAKTEIGYRLANLGVEVFYVNGTKGQRLESLMLGKSNVLCTHVHANSI